MAASQNLRRVVFAIFALGFAVAATVLSLSDAVPVFVRPLKAMLTMAGHMIERILNINISRDAFPIAFDTAGHAAIWGFGMLIVGYGLRRRVWVPLLSALMIIISLGFELLQGVYTATRTVSVTDGLGNVAGILLATLIVLASGPLVDWWIDRSGPGALQA